MSLHPEETAPLMKVCFFSLFVFRLSCFLDSFFLAYFVLLLVIDSSLTIGPAFQIYSNFRHYLYHHFDQCSTEPNHVL